MAAPTYLNSTTLAEAVTETAERFTVAATTNIVKGQLLVVDKETMLVNAIPVSGSVSVTRGYDGTLARPHKNGRKVWIGDPDKFKNLHKHAVDLGVVGDPETLPQYLLPGSRAVDGMGNEYIMLDSTATLICAGCTVLISPDGEFTASIPTVGLRGAVAVAAEGATSDQWFWGQIYGYALAQDTIGDSAGTSALIAVVATTASTPSVGMAAEAATTTEPYMIQGMFISGVPSTATTSAASHTGVAYPVFLNYPYLSGLQTRTITSNS